MIIVFTDLVSLTANILVEWLCGDLYDTSVQRKVLVCAFLSLWSSENSIANHSIHSFSMLFCYKLQAHSNFPWTFLCPRESLIKIIFTFPGIESKPFNGP